MNGTPPHQMSDEEYVVDRAARTLYARLPVGRLNWSAAGENVRVYYRAVVRAVIETYDHYESVVDEAL